MIKYKGNLLILDGRAVENISNKRRDNLFFISWSVSIIATFGSLYFSEIKQFVPCELCWFQRICMYPLTILLGVAYVKKDWNMSLYTILLSGIGGTMSLYHYLLQKLPYLHSQDFCGIVPCTAQYIDWAGFITIPFLALIAFCIIFGIHVYLWTLRNRKGGVFR